MAGITRKRWDEAIARMHGDAEAFATKIAPAYAALNWTWFATQRIPSKYEIAELLHRLIRDLEGRYDPEGHSIATGGLEVEIACDDDGFEANLRFGCDYCSDADSWDNANG